MPERIRTAARVSGRVLAGIIAAGTAAAVVTVVAFVPLPTLGRVPEALSIMPVAGDEFRVCPGSALRFGTADGSDADTAYALGAVTQRAGSAVATPPARERLTDPGTEQELPSQGPLVLRGPAESNPVGAQSQQVTEAGLTGLAASACLEPGSTAWLVGGATTVGRTTLLELSNPSEVDAVVSLRLWGAEGELAAAGTSGITVPASSRRVVSLAAYAPGESAPVIEVTARGGRVVAVLQHSVVRGLDTGGLAIVPPTAEPATALVIPGIRILDSTRVASASSRAGWDDAEPTLRLLAPEDATDATVVLTPDSGADVAPTSFVLELAPGQVMDVPLTSGVMAELNTTLPDGAYTVTIAADAPVVGAVRASTAGSGAATGSGAPPSDLAWFVAAPALTDELTLAVADGPRPLLTLANPGETPATVTLSSTTDAVVVPPGESLSVAVPAGIIDVRGTAGMHAQLSFAGAAQLGGYPVIPPRPLAGEVLVRL